MPTFIAFETMQTSIMLDSYIASNAENVWMDSDTSNTQYYSGTEVMQTLPW
jgi:hypothetical protein